MTRNMKSLFRTICLSLIAMILLTFGACSLDHGQIPGDQLETYNIVFIFDDAEGNLVAEKVVEVSKGKTIRTSQIPLIKETLEREGYIVPESYSVYWVLLNKEKQPINLDPTADVNNLENITSDICDNEGKVYVQTAYRKIGGAVTFFSNGGTPVQSIVGLEEGASLSEHKPADPTKVGYTFVGWFNKELTEEFNWNTALPAEGVDLYAKWEANKETAYVVEYYFEQLDGNYNLEETEKLSAATEELVSVKALEFEGFTHNPKHAEAKLEGNVLPDGSLVLKAYYTRNEYTVSFDVDGGEEKAEQTYKYGETLELGSTTKTGYTFLGWLLEGKELTHRTMPAQDLELVANWTVSMGIEYRIEHYFEELDGTYAKDAKVDVRSGKTGDLVSAKLREVEGFEHNADHKEAKEEAAILADGSLVLKVFYSRSEYTVSFDANGGAQKAEQTYKYGQTLELGETSKVGYTFGEWLYQGNQLVYETMPAQNLELVAKWTPNKDTAYTVEHYFEQLDGSYKLDAKVDELEGTTEAKVSAVAREVSGFTHNASHKDALETGNVLPDGSLTLKVYYARNTYTLTVNVDGDKEEIEYLFEEEVEALTSPEKTGYTFKAWSPAVPATMPAEDLEVVAQWTINQYTITLDTGEASYDFTFDYNEKVVIKEPWKYNDSTVQEMLRDFFEDLRHWYLGDLTIDGVVDQNGDSIVFAYVDPTAADKFGDAINNTDEFITKWCSSVIDSWGLFNYGNSETGTGFLNQPAIAAKWSVLTNYMNDLMGGNFWGSAYGSYLRLRDYYNGKNSFNNAMNGASYDKVPQQSILTLVKEGYTFKGWSPAIPTTMPAQDLVLTPVWSINQYDISFDLDGGYFTTFDQFVAEIVELFANSDEPNSKVTTKETFHTNSNPNIKGVYNKAENLEAHKWLFEFVKKEINAINSESSYVIETTEMLDKMIAGDTTAIGGSYANGRTLFRHFVHNMINKNHESVNSAYTKYVPDFSLAENQEKAFAALNDVVFRFDYQENVTISLIPVKPGYIFKGWNPVAPTTMPAEDVELSAIWVNELENAKNLALTALDEFMKSDDIVKASHYEINNAQLLTEYANQKELINAADTVEAVEKVLENAKETLLLIAAPIAPTAIHINAASKTPLVGASLALQLSFEGPEGYKKNVEIVSSNEEIATISNGVVTFLATGTVTITVSSAIDPAIKDSFEFVVGTADMSKVVVSPTATENNVLLYNEQEYFYGVNLFASLSTAVSKVQAGGTVVLTAGVHNLTADLTISKTITILGPNADKTVDKVRNTEAEIAFGSAGLFINAANVKFNGVKLNASGSNTYLLASAEDLTITSCYAYNFNSFLRTDAAIAGGTIRIENNILEKVTQFLLWVKAGHGAKLENVEFNNNIVMGTGTVSSNGMLRISETSASGLKVNVFNNTFNNFASATNFLFRTASGTMTIKFNVFENVSNYFIADSGTIVFEHNLLLDQNSEPQFPGTLNGVAIGDSCSSKEDLVDKYIEAFGLYKIMYELNGGSFEGNYPRGYDDLEGVELVNPVKAGYNFGGWFDNESLTGDALTAIAAGTGKSLKLYAKWQAMEYTLSFVLNGGSDKVINGDPSTSMDLTAYSNDGGTAGIYICDTSITSSYSLRYQYKILLEYDAELDAYEIVAVDAAKRGINDAASEEGVVWTHALSSSSSNITTLVNRGQYIVLDSELVLDSPNVAYVCDLGQFDTIKDTTFTVESEINLLTPKKDGYTFAGWYDNAEFSGEKVTMISAGTSGNKVYYAKWEEVVYTIEYELNGGASYGEYPDLAAIKADFNTDYKATTGYNDYSHWYGSTSPIMNVFTKTNHKWDWLLDYWTLTNTNSYNGVSNATIFQQVKTSGTCSDYYYLSTEIAGWYLGAQKAVYSGNLKSANYADDSVNELIWYYAPKKSSYTISMTEDYHLVAPYRENYTFLGWYDNEDFEGEIVTKIAAGSIGNVKLYAKWEQALANADVTYNVTFASKSELLDAFLYDFYQFLLEKEVITNTVTFDEFSGRNNSYIGKWYEYQQMTYDPTTGTVFTAAGYTHSANHMILTDSTGVLAKDEAYFFNSTKYGAKWYNFGVWINNSIGTSNRFFTGKYGGCELLRWATGAAGTSYGASFDTGIYMSSLSWTVNYNTESSAVMPTMYKHGSTFAGWLDESSNLYTELPIADPVELTLTPSWNN